MYVLDGVIWNIHKLYLIKLVCHLHQIDKNVETEPKVIPSLKPSQTFTARTLPVNYICLYE